MEDNDALLSSFPFPFPPYVIQEQLMRELYKCVEDRCVGLMESPTGTGKTLSIICSVLKWQRDFQAGKTKSAEEVAEDAGAMSKSILSDEQSDGTVSMVVPSVSIGTDEPDWVKQFAKKQLLEKIAPDPEPPRPSCGPKRRRVEVSYDKGEDSELLLPEVEHQGSARDYDSDSQDEDEATVARSADGLVEEVGNDVEVRPKVIYCSRTHSQLSQFAEELRKTMFGNLHSDGGSSSVSSSGVRRPISVTVLGSRAQLCIHPVLSKLRPVGRINDRCLELLRTKAPKTGKCACPYYDRSSQIGLKEEILSVVRDIEEIVKEGKRRGACPYYGTRAAVQQAELVLCPYPTLMSADTRKSLGLNLSGAVVVIDEAHNVIDAIQHTYSVELTGSEMLLANTIVEAYLEKYKKRLSKPNVQSLQQLVTVLRAIRMHLKTAVGDEGAASLRSPERNGGSSGNVHDGPKRMYSLNDYVFALHIDHINLIKLKQFVEASQLVQKLNGFIDKHGRDLEGADDSRRQSDASLSNPMYSVLQLLEALTNDDANGRILVSASHSIKFLMLNASDPFSPLLKECRSVILIGGTLKPLNDYHVQLLPTLASDRIRSFSCDHVIPKSNLLTITVKRGPTVKHDMEFTYANRYHTDQVDDAGRMLVNLSRIVPDGIVVFFASYKFEEAVYKRWLSCGIIRTLEQKKRFFREPRESGDMQKILDGYKEAVDCGRGAILSSVMGGKMSEGINFSDGLGRCVVVVGLPYPSKDDPELQEKMGFLTSKNVDANDYYENLCMKTVNQSIGRAIRHRNDYSCIVLCDARWTKRKTLRGKLPNWIVQSLEDTFQFPEVVRKVAGFFRTKAQSKRQ